MEIDMKLGGTLAVACGALVLFGAGVVFGQQYQPNMYSALNRLQAARGFLYAAPATKGGHRANAIALVDQAIRETQAGIRYDNIN
jgi:hypothetical protein